MARRISEGPNLLMYNTRVFPTPPDSWRVVFVKQDLPDGKNQPGAVQAYDGPIYIADAALFVKATQPQLGSKTYQLTRNPVQRGAESPARPATADPSLLA